MIRCMRAVMKDLMAFQGRAFEDVAAARELLSSRPDCTGRSDRGVLHGGGFALVAATKGFGASALRSSAAAEQILRIVDGACPIVASFGQRDPLNRGSGQRLEEVLTEKNIPHDVKTYPHAGHSFADRAPLQALSRITGFGENKEAAADAWQRVFTFFDQHLQ